MPFDSDFYQLDLFPPVLATRKVGTNCHIAFDGAYYSVPHTLFKSSVIVRAAKTFIDILDSSGRCVASHKRSYTKRSYITDPSHMPAFYFSSLDFTSYDAARFKKWAKDIGDYTYRFIDALLSRYSIEEHSYKSCMAILQFSKKFGPNRLNDACAHALLTNMISFYSIYRFLVSGASFNKT